MRSLVRLFVAACALAIPSSGAAVTHQVRLPATNCQIPWTIDGATLDLAANSGFDTSGRLLYWLQDTAVCPINHNSLSEDVTTLAKVYVFGRDLNADSSTGNYCATIVSIDPVVLSTSVGTSACTGGTFTGSVALNPSVSGIIFGSASLYNVQVSGPRPDGNGNTSFFTGYELDY